MPIKAAIRTCKCKYCDKQFTMFMDVNGELIFFPENTPRPAWGYYELLDHIREKHKDAYGLIAFSENMLKQNVEDCYVISQQ